MKKALVLIIVSVLLLGCLSGCDLSVNDETRNVYTEGTGSPANSETATGTTEQTSTEATQVEATIAQTVVFDQNNVKITAVELVDGWIGTEVKLTVENNTNKNIALSGDNFVVNGITVSGYLYIDVAAGKKSNDVITFYSEELEKAGIENIATVKALDAHIFDSDSFDTICQTPFSLFTSLGENYQQTVQDDGDVIFNEAGVEVIAQKYTDSIFGPAIRLLVKNNCGKDIIVSAENISVNDFTVSAWLYDTVYEDTVRYCELDVFNSELEDNGISKVEHITFTLDIIEATTLDRIAESDELKVIVADE